MCGKVRGVVSLGCGKEGCGKEGCGKDQGVGRIRDVGKIWKYSGKVPAREVGKVWECEKCWKEAWKGRKCTGSSGGKACEEGEGRGGMGGGGRRVGMKIMKC
jgi:hypothetical protein